MNALGEYLLRNRLHAVSVTLLCASSLFLSPVASIILALVTLRQGNQQGLWVLMATVTPTLVYYFFASADLFLVLSTVLTSVLIWTLADQLRRTNSWSWVLQLGTFIGIVCVLVTYLVNPEINTWLDQRLAIYWQQLKITIKYLPVEHVTIGMQVTGMLATGLLWLVAGRWWQARLFNPGQLQAELHTIRIGKTLAVMLVVILVAAQLTQAPLVVDLVPIATSTLLIAGLSVVHYGLKVKKITVLWLVLLYVLIAIWVHYAVAGLILVGCLDSFLNLRAKLNDQYS